MIDITVVITSALFVDEKGNELLFPSKLRLDRLNYTLSHLKHFEFKSIIIIDNTFPKSFENIKGIIEINNLSNLFFSRVNLIDRSREYNEYGPSRLEVSLINKASDSLKSCISTSHVLKISSGYRVNNLEKILEKYENGLIYRFGNPFRVNIKFCLTAFYILPVEYFFSFSDYCIKNYLNINKNHPLEAILYKYITTQKYFLIISEYPDINATFLSSNRKSNSINYQLKNFVFSFLARVGIYTLKLK